MALDETVESFRLDEALPTVTWIIPYDEACAKHISRTLQCSQPFLIVSCSMSSTEDPSRGDSYRHEAPHLVL